MQTDQIRYLIEVNRTHSIRRAAESLNITPQALSQSIKTLEKEFGMELTQSSSYGTIVTKSGLDLMDAGSAFLNSLEEIRLSRNQRYDYLPRANVSLLAAQSLADTVLPPAISSLLCSFPQLSIDLRSCRTSDSMRLIESRCKDYEIAFLSLYQYEDKTLPVMNIHPQLAFYPLMKSQYYCSVPTFSALTQYSSISIRTMLKHPTLIYKPAEEIMVPLLEEFGSLDQVRFVDGFGVFSQMLKDGNYLSFARVFHTVNPMMPTMGRKLIPLQEDITVEFGYIHHRSQNFSPAIQEFISFIENYYESSYHTVA